jgi:pimeloyl-ACP methyl ester carboxylesterase
VRFRSIAVVLASAALALTACSSSGSTPTASPTPNITALPTSAAPRPTPDALAVYYNQKVSWHGCDNGFQCATFLVPLDYAHPTGSRLQIAAVRLHSSGKHRGSLIINPGGPGGSAIDYARAARQVVPSSVREHYDVVGYDPRGVGESAPIRCVSGSFLDRFNSLDPLVAGSQRTEFINLSKQFDAACKTKAGRLLPHVATIDAARDMDVLRATLGDPKLTYMGKSYGTYLGALYANLFPTHVRALILDGAIDPAETAETGLRIQARGFETALSAFLRDCVANGCSLGSSYSSALRTLDNLYASVASNPLPANGYSGADGRVVNRALLEYGVASALYSHGDWPFLRQALDDAQHGDGSRILVAADRLAERDENGHYTNLVESNISINCVDRPAPRDLATYVNDAAVWGRESPHFGAFEAWSLLPCAYWPYPAVTKPGALTAKGAPPILVIGTLRDPATPYVDAQRMSAELASGVLLTYDGDGHTVYGTGQSGCVDRIGNAYLLDLKVPQKGTRC